MHLSYLADFVKDIDFANKPYTPVLVSGEGVDAFALACGDHAFGWARSYMSSDVSNIVLNISDLENGRYSVQWFDSWEGKAMPLMEVNTQENTLQLKVPALSTPRQDMAFKIAKID
jgi:hypothetical protein